MERKVYLSLDDEHDYRNQSRNYSFADEVEECRQFMMTRIAWMNKQFKKSNPNIYMEQSVKVLPAEKPDASLLWSGAIVASVILLLSGGTSAALILRRRKAN